MRRPNPAMLIVVLLALSATTRAAGPESPQADAADVEFFEAKVRPALADHCVRCHGPTKQRAGLRLDSPAAILTGGEGGPVLVPGDPEASRLIQVIRYDDDLQMPPKGKLADPLIADLTSWVKRGAPTPPDHARPATAPASPRSDFDLAERRRHWAFQPIRTVPPPPVHGDDGPLAPIDAFLRAKLDAAGLSPAPAADKRTLIRRASFDLTGLPPTPAEVAAFLADDSPAAFARVVDRLLASPHFGERWGRHWLDLVRYAETRGHESDYLLPNAYQYRDYVVRALNADVPYDQFVTEHVAGDLLEHPRLDPRTGGNESILATGFWLLGEEVHSPVDIRADETERLANKIDVMSKAFLALTVACARCHDHKFDAISQRDYYALEGFLLSSRSRQAPFETMEHNRRIAADLHALRARHRPRILRAVADAQRPTLDRLADLLLAAREVIQHDTADPQHLASIADQHHLDTALLGKWVVYLKQVRTDPADPMHMWGDLAPDVSRAGSKLERFSLGLRTLSVANPPASPLAKGGHRGVGNPWGAIQSQTALAQGQTAGSAHPTGISAASAPAQETLSVVVDYGHPGPEDWIQDGFSFIPVRPGDVRLGTDTDRPIVSVFTEGAARVDRTWDGLTVAPDTERDPGKVQWIQAGHTLSTRSFTLNAGKLYYLVRGSGRAYASVNGHRMIAGPLHGALVREWGGGEAPHWVEQDLSSYRGHLLHVEFTPKRPEEVQAGESADLAILMIAQADSRPQAIEPPNRKLAQLLDDPHIDSAEALAQAYQSLLSDVSARLGADQIRDRDDAEDVARLADWMVRHPELFQDAELRQRVAEAARPFLDRQEELAARIRRVSHTAPTLLDGSGVDERLLIRGNSRTPGEPVPRRFLEAIAGPDQSPPALGSGRRELARRMTDPSHPLLARVLVNRAWQHLFGQGIVPTVDNFGVLGEPPSHPELLDYLAVRFVADGWSVKRLIRSLVLSRSYQMTSRAVSRAEEADPRNLLLHRMPVRRLEGEAIRDAILATSGRLDRRLAGPSVEVFLSPFMDGRGKPASSGPLDGDGRRSLYIKVRRNFLPAMLLAFDFPVPFTTIGRRGVSNVPTQALTLMNSPFVVAQARLWADRTLADPDPTPEHRLAILFETAFARPPTAAEQHAALAFLREQAGQYGTGADDPRAWADLCHVLFNVKEFIFIP
jgi:cytochrome c553